MKKLLVLDNNDKSKNLAKCLSGSVVYYYKSCTTGTMLHGATSIGKIVNPHLDGLSLMYWCKDLYLDLEQVQINPFQAFKYNIGFKGMRIIGKTVSEFGIVKIREGVDEDRDFVCRDSDGYEFHLSEHHFNLKQNCHHVDDVEICTNGFKIIEIENETKNI